MKYQNTQINRSAFLAQFIANCQRAEFARPEITGALRVAYGANADMVIDLES